MEKGPLLVVIAGKRVLVLLDIGRKKLNRKKLISFQAL